MALKDFFGQGKPQRLDNTSGVKTTESHADLSQSAIGGTYGRDAPPNRKKSFPGNQSDGGNKPPRADNQALMKYSRTYLQKWAMELREACWENERRLNRAESENKAYFSVFSKEGCILYWMQTLLKYCSYPDSVINLPDRFIAALNGLRNALLISFEEISDADGVGYALRAPGQQDPNMKQVFYRNMEFCAEDEHLSADDLKKMIGSLYKTIACQEAALEKAQADEYKLLWKETYHVIRHLVSLREHNPQDVDFCDMVTKAIHEVEERLAYFCEFKQYHEFANDTGRLLFLPAEAKSDEIPVVIRKRDGHIYFRGKTIDLDAKEY